MPKKDGYKTKTKILQVAEGLFAEKGFDGTSIETIAKAAGVNKGLIYYHFKDKNDIVISIFQNIIQEIGDFVDLSFTENSIENGDEALEGKVRSEIEYCMKRKKIISVMLMESLKSDNKTNFLFQCAEIVIKTELGGIKKKMGATWPDSPEERHRMLVHEFFTGFIPIVSFVAFQEKWCDYFNCDKKKALDYFLDSFAKTHLISHSNIK